MIRPEFALGVQVPDVGQAINTYNNALITNERLAASKQNRQQSAERHPLDLRFTEGRIAQNDQSLQSNEIVMNDQRRNQYMKSVASVKSALDPMIAAGDIDGVMGFLNQRGAQLKAAGLPTETTDEAYQMAASGDLMGIKNGYDLAYNEVYGNSGKSLAQREHEALVQTYRNDPESVEGRAAGVKLGFNPRAVGSSSQTIANTGQTETVAESQATIEGEKAGAKTTKTGIAKRAQDHINIGLESSDAFNTVTRALELLDVVETGGWTNEVALRAKQAFGIESADEGELSNALGKSVLSQLKTIFGAAFTEAEGARLERIEAGFGKNNATNIRLLKRELKGLERKAKRGLKAAQEVGDQDTIDALQEGLDALEAYRASKDTPTADPTTPSPANIIDTSAFSVVEIKD